MLQIDQEKLYIKAKKSRTPYLSISGQLDLDDKLQLEYFQINHLLISKLEV